MQHSDSIQRAAFLLRNAERAVALTGAGISTPSGVPDFRSPESGLWDAVDPFEVASIYGFVRKPEAFYNWIRPLANTVRDAEPNAAHVALAQMEAGGYLKAVITQNIDMLHTRAGSREVHEIHGHMREATCIQCHTVYTAEPYVERLVSDGEIPKCPACGGVLKPNTILFGEQLPADALSSSVHAVRTCDAMLVAGSSLEVTPVADWPRTAHASGAALILVNYEPTYADGLADVVIHDDVATILPQIAAELGVAGR